MTIVFLPNWYHSFTNILLKAKAKFTYQRKPTCSLFFIGASRCYSHPSANHKVVNAKNVILLCNEATKKQTSSIIVFFRWSAQIQTIIFKAGSACILRNLWAEIMSWVFVQPGKFSLDGATNSSVDWTFRLTQDLFVDHKTYLLTTRLICWPQDLFVDHKTYLLTIRLICWPQDLFVDHKTYLLTTRLICWQSITWKGNLFKVCRYTNQWQGFSKEANRWSCTTCSIMRKPSLQTFLN